MSLLNRENLLGRLSRAVTMDNGYLTDHLTSDLRMIQHVGAKFLGRAAHVWVLPDNDEARFGLAADYAAAVHAVDHDIVLQAAVFEAIFPELNEIPVPAWVFELLGEPVEQRNFRFADMITDLSMAKSMSGVWLETGRVPDLTQAEARRWYIYRCGRYFDAGYEAIHLGQIHLVGARDQGMHHTAELIDHIRRLAAQRARRGEVILDAHSHGIVLHGRLLLDFISRPLSGVARMVDGQEQLCLQWKGGLAAGWHYGGWYAEEQPNLVEIDNWGGRCWPKDEWNNEQGRASQGRWGWDDINWFARRTDQQRADFLHYAHRLCRLSSPMNFFQPPLCRTLGNAPMVEHGPTATHYRANNCDDDCPSGRGDEGHIVELWRAADPQHWQVQGTSRPNAVEVPQPVVLLGSLQQQLGGAGQDTLCPFSRLVPVGASTCARTIVIPWPGTYDFVVAAGGTRMEPLGQGMSPGGEPWQVTTVYANQCLRIIYDYFHRTLSVTDAESGKILAGNVT